MAFKIEGKEGTFPTMLAVAKELGRARVYRKDFEKFGVEEVQEAVVVEATDVNEIEAPEAPEVEAPTTQEVEAETPTEDAGLDKDDALDKLDLDEAKEVEPEPEAKKQKAPKKPRAPKEVTPEQLEKADELKKVIGFDEIYDWAVAMKKTKTEDVRKMAEAVGATWTETGVERVTRMRMVMAIRELVFPGQKRPKVNRSAWRGVPMETLLELAEANDVEVKEFDDARIKRMRLIQELKKVGVESPAGT